MVKYLYNCRLYFKHVNSRYFPGLSHAENFPIIKTSPKTENNSNSEENTNLTDEIQETVLDIPASPILRKSKNKTSKSNSCNETLKSPNK